MKTDHLNFVSALQLEGIEYKIEEKLIASQSLRGRATHVWTVVNASTNARLIIKDCWIAAKQHRNEIEVLKEIRGVSGVPEILAGELVQFRGQDDSTAWLRHGFNFHDLRYHLRIAMSPIGLPLSKFDSKKELIGVFLDKLQSKTNLIQVSWILIRSSQPIKSYAKHTKYYTAI